MLHTNIHPHNVLVHLIDGRQFVGVLADPDLVVGLESCNEAHADLLSRPPSPGAWFWAASATVLPFDAATYAGTRWPSF